MHSKTEAEIRTIIESNLSHNAESLVVEFKDARGGLPGDTWKAITAFSNTTNGGLIVFGIYEDPNTRRYTVVGELKLQELQEQLTNYLNNKIKNCGQNSLKIVDIMEHSLLVLAISEISREQKPCYNTDMGMPKGACIRAGNTNRQMTEEELKTILRYTPQYRYDRKALENVTTEVLSDVKINQFLEKSAKRTGRETHSKLSKEKVLKNKGIIIEVTAGIYAPTIGGALLFSENNPQDIAGLERYVTRCVRYAGKSASTKIISQQELFNTLDRQIEGALQFVLRNINYGATIEGAKRVERYEYPEEALREIIANAVIHRDYLITGTYTQVAVYSDRIEISNAGTLPPGITISNLKDSQFSRNEIISNVMRELDFMEEFGRGIDLVYARMSEYGLNEPLFKNSSNMFKVTLLGTPYKELNERQIKIWNYLQENNKGSVSEFMRTLFPDNIARSTINNDTKKMVDMELITLRGSSNNTYYEPKY